MSSVSKSLLWQIAAMFLFQFCILSKFAMLPDMYILPSIMTKRCLFFMRGKMYTSGILVHICTVYLSGFEEPPSWLETLPEKSLEFRLNRLA